MIVVLEPALNNSYNEDINNTTGTALVTGPCVIRSITFTNDTGSSIVCSIHDATATTGATAATKKIKAVVAANSNVQFQYVAGKKFTTAVFAKPNAAGLDIAMDYD